MRNSADPDPLASEEGRACPSSAGPGLIKRYCFRQEEGYGAWFGGLLAAAKEKV